MTRRELLLLAELSAACALLRPLSALAQQNLPVLGVLTSRGRTDAPQLLAAFHEGLREVGFVEGQNLTIVYRFADNRNDRLARLAADLAGQSVNAIAALTTPAAFAAKAATATIPIVFEGGTDPVQLKLVASLARPGGNITGITHITNEIAPKRLELLRQVVPAATAVALLANPNNPAINDAETAKTLSTASALGLKLHILNAGDETALEAAFAQIAQLGAGGLIINADPFFTARQEQLAILAMRHSVPTVYSNREFVIAGGLMSYGGGIDDGYRLAGVYAGRILKGEKPSELPVQQSTKVELFVNLRTAKALGITVPPLVRTRADEVIE